MSLGGTLRSGAWNASKFVSGVSLWRLCWPRRNVVKKLFPSERIQIRCLGPHAGVIIGSRILVDAFWAGSGRVPFGVKMRQFCFGPSPLCGGIGLPCAFPPICIQDGPPRPILPGYVAGGRRADPWVLWSL